MEDAAEDPVGRSAKEDQKREGPIQDPRPVRGRTMHRRDSRLFANDRGGEAGGAARAATRTNGDGGGSGGVEGAFSFSLMFLSFLSLLFFVFFSSGWAWRGQGELPRAASGL